MNRPAREYTPLSQRREEAGATDLTNMNQNLKDHLRNGHREIASLPPQEIALCHDGLPWEPKRVGEQLCRIYGRILNDLLEIGKYLLMAKTHLPQDQYQAWLSEYFPESREAAARYILLAQRVYRAKDQHEVIRFLDTAAGNSKTKIYELLNVSDDEIQEAMRSDDFMGKPLEDVGSMSYRQLKEELKRKDVTVKHLTERRSDLEKEVSELRLAKYGDREPDELTLKITRIVMALGELSVYLEGIPEKDLPALHGMVISPIQVQFDQLLTALGANEYYGGAQDEETR